MAVKILTLDEALSDLVKLVLAGADPNLKLVEKALAAEAPTICADVLQNANDLIDSRVGAITSELLLAQANSMSGGADFSRRVQDQVGNAICGQHEAGWLSYYDFFGRCGVEGPERLNGLMTVARNSGWWWPFEEAAICTERPAELHRDDQGRLHNVDGPAISYPDGWAIYAVHGVRVPSKVILDPASLTPAEITGERNAEVRRVMLERFGFERYIKEAGAKKVHSDDFGTLWRAELPDDEPLVLVEVLNSTPEPDGSFKTYFLRVPPTMKRAKEAIAWTFEMSEKEYDPRFQS